LLFLDPDSIQVLIHRPLDIPNQEAWVAPLSAVVACRKQLRVDQIPRQRVAVARSLHHAARDEHLLNFASRHLVLPKGVLHFLLVLLAINIKVRLIVHVVMCCCSSKTWSSQSIYQGYPSTLMGC